MELPRKQTVTLEHQERQRYAVCEANQLGELQ